MIRILITVVELIMMFGGSDFMLELGMKFLLLVVNGLLMIRLNCEIVEGLFHL